MTLICGCSGDVLGKEVRDSCPKQKIKHLWCMNYDMIKYMIKYPRQYWFVKRDGFNILKYYKIIDWIRENNTKECDCLCLSIQKQ